MTKLSQEEMAAVCNYLNEDHRQHTTTMAGISPSQRPPWRIDTDKLAAALENAEKRHDLMILEIERILVSKAPSVFGSAINEVHTGSGEENYVSLIFRWQDLNELENAFSTRVFDPAPLT